jgi:hypothetical protein
MSQKGQRVLTSGPGPFKLSQMNFQLFQTLEFNLNAFPCSKNTQTLHEARLEYFEQLSQLGQLHIPKFESYLNFKGVQTLWGKSGKFTKNLS